MRADAEQGQGRGAAANDTAPESPVERYFNRELSWLEFNDRVLEEACNGDFPLLERLRFLSISGSNLDEFLMIRVAGLVGQVQRGIETPSIDGRTPARQLSEVLDRVDRLIDKQQATWRSLRALLAEEGIHIAAEERIDDAAHRWLKDYFLTEVVSVITPQAIDPAHPFPFIANEGLGLLFNVRREDEELVEMVLIPSALPRFVRVPGDEALYISIESLIVRFAEKLFTGFEVCGHGAFRVLRDSDIEIEEEAEDLVRTFRTAIQRRRRGQVIQLEIDENCDPAAEAMLREKLLIPGATTVKTDSLLGIQGLSDIVSEDRPDLKFEPFQPRYPERVREHDGDVFAAIREKPFIVHHPYESFDVVVDFIRQAAVDPQVVAIKQSLYRAGSQSAVVEALVQAAENGKSVTAVVELKARFDEEQNLIWASKLERAGVQVIYGFVDWKTHAKLSMVVRREDDGFRTYCHMGTGNYHPVTAKVYTDLSFFTADPRLGRDAGRVFNFVTGYVEPSGTELLAVSPVNLRQRLEDLIDAEAANARSGKPAAIWAKMNQLTDRDMIEKLYDASQAGVDIQLVVRGICDLRPGVPGMSDNIVVKSIIGRFLEHGRIYAFANGATMPSDRALVFTSSADLMTRNLDRRVEHLVPIDNQTVHDQVLEQVMLANLLDTQRSWFLNADGSYERADPGEQPFNCHSYFMNNPSLSGRGGALEPDRVPRLALRKGAAA